MFEVDWPSVFSIETSTIELIIRGTAIYLALFVLLRIVLKRQSGAVGITDLLVIVLLADAAQNALSGGYESIPEGLILVVTIIFWAFALDWLGYRIHRIQHFIHPKPLPLVKEGQLLPQNLRRELITEDELMGQIRLEGIDDVSLVKEAYMESDGRISVIRQNEEVHGPSERPQV